MAGEHNKITTRARTGLGMQITFASMKQAGGQPLVIGAVVGTTKAALALVVILLFVSETI